MATGRSSDYATRRAWFAVAVLLLLLIPVAGCAEPVDGFEGIVYADMLRSYKAEVRQALDMTIAKLIATEDALGDGLMTTREFRITTEKIYLLCAYTLEYIDSKPIYQRLYPELYHSAEPPALPWAMPEFASDSDAAQAEYADILLEYIALHNTIVGEGSEPWPNGWDS